MRYGAHKIRTTPLGWSTGIPFMKREDVTWVAAELLFPECSVAWDVCGGDAWCGGDGELAIIARHLYVWWADRMLPDGKNNRWAMWDERSRTWIML